MSWESILKKPIQTTTERLEALGLGKDTIATLEGEEKYRGSNLKVLQPRQTKQPSGPRTKLPSNLKDELRGMPQTQQQPATAPDEEPQTPEQIKEARKKTERVKRKKLSTRELLGRAQSKVGVSPKSKKPTKTSEQLLTERRAASKKLVAGKEQPSMIEAQKENKKGTSPSPYQRRRREIVAERPEREARRQAKLREQGAPHRAKRQKQKLRDERTRQEAVGGRQSRAIEEKIERDAQRAEGKQRLAAMRTETAQSQKDLMGPDSAISQVRAETAAQKKKPSAIGSYMQRTAVIDQEEAAAQKIAETEQAARDEKNRQILARRKEQAKQAIAAGTSQAGVRTGTAGEKEQQRKDAIRIVADKQEQVAGQQQKVVDDLKTTTQQAVNQTIEQQDVEKMNNDKYNAKQKGEKNRNLTPFIMPQKERPAPKSGDIPGVVQHPKRRQKKTENKW